LFAKFNKQFQTVQKMPKLTFTVPLISIRRFDSWINDLAYSLDDKWVNLRAQLRADVLRNPNGSRRRSDVLYRAIKEDLKVDGCDSDTSCIQKLFGKVLEDLKENKTGDGLTPVSKKRFADLLEGMNHVTWMQHYARSRQTYMGAISALRKQIYKHKKLHKLYAERGFGPYGPFWNKLLTTEDGIGWVHLKHGQNPDLNIFKRKSNLFKQVSDQNARRSKEARQELGITVYETEILNVGMETFQNFRDHDDYIDGFICFQMLTGLRIGEVIRYSRFLLDDQRNPALPKGHIVIRGITKKPAIQISESVWRDAFDFKLEKPILCIMKDFESKELITVQDAIEMIEVSRQEAGVYDMIAAGLSRKNIVGKFVPRINKRIRQLFPDQAWQTDKTNPASIRKNQIGSHFLRKIYANYGFLSLSDPAKVRREQWLMRVMGWETASVGVVSNYTDVYIKKAPTSLPALRREAKTLQKHIAQTKKKLKQLENRVDRSESKDMSFADFVYLQKKACRRYFTFNAVEFEIPLRQSRSDEQKISLVSDIVSDLRAAKIMKRQNVRALIGNVSIQLYEEQEGRLPKYVENDPAEAKQAPPNDDAKQAPPNDDAKQAPPNDDAKQAPPNDNDHKDDRKQQNEDAVQEFMLDNVNAERRKRNLPEIQPPRRSTRKKKQRTFFF